MSWQYLTNLFSSLVMILGLPLVNLYINICENPFLNISAEDAAPLEKAGNILLLPTQYLLDGKRAIPTNTSTGPAYRFEERFDYDNNWKIKTIGSCALLPVSVVFGSIVKGASYLLPDTYDRHQKITDALHNTSYTKSNTSYYESLGINLFPTKDSPRLKHLGFQRRPEDSQQLEIDRKALREIVSLFEEEKIPYWIDCGTCLGAYRYGGTIPWDNDIDIGILLPDFENVKRILSRLDPNEYIVQDWSSRGKPNTYLKVFVKKSASLIDIYNYHLDEKEKTLTYILSNEDNIFLPDSWRIRERKYTKPVPFDMIFPLKRAQFDGLEVYVPNKTEDYLHVRYGENLSPSMIFNPVSDEYEKDLSHPYWNS
jgi:phosphorylcholine metabolism protein LicD